jgi:hypothetical protein
MSTPGIATGADHDVPSRVRASPPSTAAQKPDELHDTALSSAVPSIFTGADQAVPSHVSASPL